MYTSIKTHYERFSLQIMSYVNNYIQRERERDFFLFYRLLDIEISYQFLKYWNLENSHCFITVSSLQ